MEKLVLSSIVAIVFWCQAIKASVVDENFDIDIYKNSTKIRYDGAQVWKLYVTPKESALIVPLLKTRSDVSLWQRKENFTMLLVKKPSIKNAKRMLKAVNLKYEVVIPNVQGLIPPKILKSSLAYDIDWHDYNSFHIIQKYLREIERTHPNLCKLIDIGKSHEGRPIRIVRIGNGHKLNKAIWIDGGFHAREWISHAAVTYIIRKLVTQWRSLPNRFRRVDWYILPVVNPDGYEYSRSVDRMWNKNRRKFGKCNGVDLNRNFNINFGENDSPNDPCDSEYGGTAPFSEPETKAMANFLKSIRPRLAAYLSYHSFGKYIMYPYGFKPEVPKDAKALSRVANLASSRVETELRESYKTGPSHEFGQISGSADDWVKAVLRVKYVYTIELGDAGKYMFLQPPKYIESSAKEAWIITETVARAITRS